VRSGPRALRRPGTPRGGRGTRGAASRGLGLALAAVLGVGGTAPARLAAQEVVGHRPDQSPFRDITNKQGFTLFVGRFAGNTGPAQAAARPGLIVGARLQVRLSGPLDFWATYSQASSSRRVIDASGDTAFVVGVENLRLLFGDVGFGLNLTGNKTWHRLAPYVGLGAGISTPAHTVLDPGGFQITTAFALMPTIGTRWFFSRSFALQLEARDYYFRYQYPLSFYNRPFTGHTDGTPVLDVSQSDRAWAHNVSLWLGVTYVFTF
jgi:hypothetical protein